MPDFTDNKLKGALITVRADAPLAGAGATFDRFCSRCKNRVMISPTGQRALREKPDLAIICMNCYLGAEKEFPVVMRYPGTMEELKHDLATAQPNPWRTRN